MTNILIITSFICLLVPFWHRNDLPRDIETLAALADEPRQTATRKAAFTAVYNDVEYLIEPEYDYDLHGMVVSFRHHDGGSRMHSRSNDHLNMLDVCVVWGDNATNPLIHKIDFWNGILPALSKRKTRRLGIRSTCMGFRTIILSPMTILFASR